MILTPLSSRRQHSAISVRSTPCPWPSLPSLHEPLTRLARDSGTRYPEDMNHRLPGRRPHGGRRITQLRRIIWSTHPHTCWLCGEPINTWREFEIDHVLPREHGGTDTLTNLRPAHGRLSTERCNQRRGSKMVTETRPVASVEQDETAWFTQGKNGVS